jgi:hypothetical protein
MFDESKYVSPVGLQALNQWTLAWYDQAVKSEFIHPPYYPDLMIIKRLRGYFHGLSPAEAAQVCFGHTH